MRSEGRASGAAPGVSRQRPVAYFSAEFGLHESLPFYAGGLGVLAGDHLKAASDAGLPMVGVGLFYAQGYFCQQIDETGRQREGEFTAQVDRLPISRAGDGNGGYVAVSVETRDGPIHAAVWTAEVGRNRLVLLDTDTDANPEEYRGLTSKLYDGDETSRIRQELLLGVGGLRALAALDIEPAVLHLNEGHCAFAALAWWRAQMSAGGDLEEAKAAARSSIVFTTHTPVAAGHDRFQPPLIERTLGPLREELGLDEQGLLSLGRVTPGDDSASFCMTVLGLRMSRFANAVSEKHGRVTRAMWADLWPDRDTDHVPIGHITNGMHVASWLAIPLFELFDRRAGDQWAQHMDDPRTWRVVDRIDDEEWWEQHQILKTRLIEFVRRSVARSDGHRDRPVADGLNLDPDVLTIGFARRLAEYKRHDLLLQDLRRLERLVADHDRPVQLLFAGVAHPDNEQGKQVIQRLFRLMTDQRFRGRVAFLEDHDINVARHLAQGVDAWLNLPRRRREACGTSGQKALVNGGINVSVRDGWWAEAFDEDVGFAIGSEAKPDSAEQEDREDHEALMHVLEAYVAPAYYERDEAGLPRRWIAMQKAAIRKLAARFSASRMIDEYLERYYHPAASGAS